RRARGAQHAGGLRRRGPARPGPAAAVDRHRRLAGARRFSHSIRAAITTSRPAKRRLDSRSSRPTESCEARNDDTRPDRPTTAAVRTSALRLRRLLRVPTIAVGMITASDDPLATAAGMPTRTTIAGTMTTPPPTPSRPAVVPA